MGKILEASPLPLRLRQLLQLVVRRSLVVRVSAEHSYTLETHQKSHDKRGGRFVPVSRESGRRKGGGGSVPGRRRHELLIAF